MEASCPYCRGNATPVYEAVTTIMQKNADAGEAAQEVAIVLCVHCGEPMALENGVFRQATFDELKELIDNEAYHRNRAVWLESERRRKAGMPAPVEHMWRLYCDNAPLTFASPSAEARARAIFFSGVAMSTAYFKEALHQDDHVFTGRMNLLETELDLAGGEPDEFEQVGEILIKILNDLARRRGDRKH